MRNEYVKWRKHTFDGEEVDLMKIVDGVLLQWYSGFDANLCNLSDDPKACACDNLPPDDYPNTWDNQKDGPEQTGFLYKYIFENNAGNNMWPTTFPIRCQACGDNVILPDGTRGKVPCFKDGEDWFEPGDINMHYSLVTSHQQGWKNYT